MRARLYICDVCGEIEDKVHGGAFYIFRYKQKLSGFSWYERHKMVMCHSCFHKMLAFCRNDEEAEWKERVDKDEGCNSEYIRGLKTAIGFINNAQAVDRPQGEWINHRNDYGHNIADCSLCGKTMQWHDEDGDGIPRYCWYCGASMKGGAE